jgi:penicillin-binding protein 1C
LRGGAARYTDYLDAESGRRVRASCATGEMQAVEMARWPAALEPWLDTATRRKALPPAWAPTCSSTPAPEGGLKIVGVSDGETIRRAANGSAPQLRLEARGSQNDLMWLLNGRQLGRLPANRALQQEFGEAGRYRITVIDDAGRYDRVEISVR